ncbi:MAG: hypothetical protein ACI4DS_06565 [Eubacterium sp.]
MHKVCGFALFWVAVGMAIALIIDTTFWCVTIIIACIIIGYNLFCAR